MEGSIWVLLLLSLVAAASAALPPGYEDELYCPKDTCLAARKMPDGFAGPRTAFHQCVSIASSLPVGSPRAWGSKLDKGYKEQLHKDGYHSKNCPKKMVIKEDDRHGRNGAAAREYEESMVKEQQQRRAAGRLTPRDGESDADRTARRSMAGETDSFAGKAELLKKKHREHAEKDAARRAQYEHDRAEHEKQHAERMEDLKEKHPEHYQRIMERRQQLQSESEESMRSRIKDKKARKEEQQAHLMQETNEEGAHKKERPLSEM